MVATEQNHFYVHNEHVEFLKKKFTESKTVQLDTTAVVVEQYRCLYFTKSIGN